MYDCLGKSTLLSWVAGNDVLLLARVYEKVLDAGEVTDLPFDLSACDDIAVTATNGYKTEVLEWAIAQDESNCLAVNIPHTLTVGEWAVEITCKRNGYHVRSFEFTFKIVETNCKAQTTFEVVDGCQSASVRVALQIVPQAEVRGMNDYEQWKLVTTSEDKSLQYFLDNVINFQSRADQINAAEAQRVMKENERRGMETNRQEAEMQREANSRAAVNAANNAAAGAERVNASLSGTTLTVTNRSGVSVSVDTKGEPGDDGVGVPSGGTAGQVLSKKSATDYDTQWVNPPAAGVNSINGKTGDVTLSASDVGALPDDTAIPDAVTEQTVSGWGFTKNTGTYSKPSGGIPSTDLSSDVQTSLGKADTALQSFTESDPTVPSWAKQSSKPSYTAQEVGALPNSTKYGSTVDLTMDSTTYVLTLSLKDQDGTVLNTKTVDLPIESVVVNGRYDAANKKIVLTLQGGSTIDVPVGDLIAGLQTEITSVNMLDADLVDDTNSAHKFVTAQEKANWNNKSDFSGSYNDLSNKPTIPDAQIQSDWNQSNSSAKDFIKNKPTIPDVTNYVQKSQTAGLLKNDGTVDTNTYLTQHQDISGKQDKIDSSHKLSADLVDDASATNKFVTANEKQTWNGKQDALTFNTTPSSSNKVATMSDIPSSLPANGGNAATVNNHTVAADVPSGAVFTDTTYSVMGASGSGHAGGLVPDTPSTAGTTKFLREDGQWEVPATSVETISGTTVTQELAPNKFYSFGEVNSLTVTLGSIISGVSNEYAFEFDSGSTATTLNIPVSVVGIDATAIQANKHYEISIKYDASNQNYYGLIQEW